MFTGIVEKSVPVLSIAPRALALRIVIQNIWPDIQHGQSIAINGVCLTVANFSPDQIAFDVIQETLDKTNLGLLKQSDRVHVERALRMGDRLDGHFVQGHVDCTGNLKSQISNSDEVRLTIDAPPGIAKYLVSKGSITVDGVSLTLAAVRENDFDVALIPMTLQLTLLGQRKIGWPFNLEADVLSKTIVSHLERQSSK